jgi:hypothetical protein
VSDAQTAATLHNLLAEDGRDLVYQQARLSSGLVDLALPSEEKYRPKPARQRNEKPIEVRRMPRMVGTVQTKKGTGRTGGVTTDGATRRTGSVVQFAKGTYEYKIYENELEVPLGLVNVARGGEGIDFLMEQLHTTGSQYGADIDVLIDGAQLSAPDSTATGTTITITDPSGYIEGEEYDHYTTGDAYQQTFRVTNIAPPSSSLFGAWTLTVESTLSVSILTTAKIYPYGAGDSTKRTASLTDVCTAATSMYGLSTANFPSGLSIALSAWDNLTGRRMNDTLAVLSGSRPTHIATNSLGASKIINASVAQRRFTSGDMDVYGGAVPKFDELPIVVSEQLRSTKIKFINAEKCFVHEFWPFGFQADGVGNQGFSPSILKLSENKVSYKGLGTAGIEFVCNHRRAFGEFTGVGDS